MTNEKKAMSDKELADRIVALGLAFRVDEIYYGLGDFIAEPIMGTKEADRFVRDWRAAGALMERITWLDLRKFLSGILIPSTNKNGQKKIDPRAIIEDCVEALL